MKLSQILAVEKGTRQRVASDVTRLHQVAQKPALFNGYYKSYKPDDEDGQRASPESHRVQNTVPALLDSVTHRLGELFDLTAQKDFTNRDAMTNIVVDGELVMEDVPPPFLLFLEKQLTDVLTIVSKLPTLDPAQDWAFDEEAGYYKSAPRETIRTQKVQRPIVLYDATDKHPAQTQLITEDVPVGTWTYVDHSGAIPVPKRDELMRRVERFLNAVKFAREEANRMEVVPLDTKWQPVLAKLLKL